MNAQKRSSYIPVIITLLILLCSCAGARNNPEDLTRRFLEGRASLDDLAPDVTYESAELKGWQANPLAWVAGELRGSSIDPFNDMWALRSDPRTHYEMEVHDLIVRDSARPNSKEVTVIYTERFSEISPPWTSIKLDDITAEDMEPVPPDQWHLTGKDVVRDQVALLIVEKLDGRWVIWCAEVEPSSDWLPDICTY